MKEALYAQVLEQLEALLDGTLPPVSNLANASALLFQALPELNWLLSSDCRAVRRL